MKRIRNGIATVSLAALLAGTSLVVTPQAASADQAGFDDRYVFAATRSVDNMDAHPALKYTLFPLTVAVDIAFLPFAVIGGYVG